MAAAKAAGANDPASYSAAITQLNQVAAVPETDTTPAQQAADACTVAPDTGRLGSDLPAVRRGL